MNDDAADIDIDIDIIDDVDDDDENVGEKIWSMDRFCYSFFFFCCAGK